MYQRTHKEGPQLRPAWGRWGHMGAHLTRSQPGAYIELMDELERLGPGEVWSQRQATFTAIRQAQECAMHRRNDAAFVHLSRMFLRSTYADTVEELAGLEAQARAYLSQLRGER